ncbi:O-antigen ligase family protein [Streptomyces sp. H10-C2]|uniref:O-antigen ligase family protein n=1 Tax=unclassified Streptomyces TaxID=2593676 RepID=UPI0024B9E0C1|nr:MULTISPECIES: O-antigen ligase family protein [unclassified Streptomyces]MDJ0340936.1 O-antigen ligase family protein [Streptomyces sp. PH10-H1]MDJ0369832.1 O-antigen ligase family protein [Streptomyces sp. H10-C2]
MSLSELIAVLRRRWYLMVPITLLSLLAGGYLYRTVPVAYESQSSIALLDSTAVAKLAPTFGNPISNAGGSLVVTADVLIRTLASTDAARDLHGLGVTDSYTVGFAANTSGPLLTLAVTGTDRAKVLRETTIITGFADEQLKALQATAKVAPAYFVQTAPVVLPQTPVSQLKSRYQEVVGVVILGTTIAFALSFVTESVALTRRRKRAGAAAPSPPAVPPPGGRAPKGLLSRRLDATTILTVYLGLALFIPSDLALPALGGVGTPANVFALLGLFWYLATWLAGRVVPAPGTRLPRVAMCLLAAAVLMSYIADANRSSSHKEVLGADRGLIGLLVWVSLVVLASAGIQERGRLEVLMRRLVVMGTVVAVIGYYDFFAATNIADSIHIPGLQSSVAHISTMDRGSFTRPRSTTAQPLEFGGMLAILVPFAVQQALNPVRRHLSWIRRWGPVMSMGGALPLTVSRTSIIGALIVALIMLPRWKPQRRWAAIGLLLGSIAGFKVIIPGLIGTITTLFATFLSNSDSSTQARTVKYSAIVPYLSERPLFGRGFGTFTPSLYFFTDNQYMLTLAEMGALGLVALLTLFITGIHTGGAIRRLARTESDRELGQAFFASAVTALVISATFDALSFPMFAGMFFLTLGAGGSYLGFIRRDAAAAEAAAGAPAAPSAPPAPRAAPARREAEPQLVES